MNKYIKDDIITIIVPIYNGEGFIKKCLDSLIKQTYKNIKIILVNDGSTDNSLNICLDYAKLDSRISVIDSPNGGVSSARNIGLSQANSQFVTFVDVDDYVSVDLCLNLIQKTNDSIRTVLCGFKREFWKENKLYNSSTIVPNKVISNKLYYGKNFAKLMDQGIIGGPWGILFSLDVIKKYNIEFPIDISYGEDLLFNYKYFYYITGFETVSETLYYYIERNIDSLTKTFNKDRIGTIRLLFETGIKFAQNKNIEKELYPVISKHYLKNVFICLEKIFFESKKISRNEKHILYQDTIFSAITKQAVNIEKPKDKEYYLYQRVIKSRSFIIIYLFTWFRWIIKKILRG